TNEVRRKLRQPFKLLLGKPILDVDVFSFNPSKLPHLLPERLQADHATGSSAIIQETYAGDFSCLLCLGWKAKSQEHDAKDKDGDFFLHGFLRPLVTRHSHLHLITFSARIITTGGIVRPSTFAVLRLIISSNFVGCSTGRSAGFAPFRILSTINAARR